MTKYIVHGGSPLFGEVHISGAKNAAVAILPAALLVDGVCRIENIPQISDVTVLLKILEQLGARVRVLNRSDVELDCRHITTTRAPQELAHKLRASYYFIGALLGRFGTAEVSMPAAATSAAPVRSISTSRALPRWARRCARGTTSARPPRAGA